MEEVRDELSNGHSTEFVDCRLSLFSAQRGKCALCGDLFESASEITCWLKQPKYLGGEERYKNMILIHKKYLPLLQEETQTVLRSIVDAQKTTKEQIKKLNSLREQAGLPAID